jgi:excinuclease UvrABC ATPase subunit
MKCPKCKGSGQYLNYGECSECKGTGVQALIDEDRVVFDDIVYKPGDILPFTNSAGNEAKGEVKYFYHKKRLEGENLVNGTISVKNIWISLTNLKTGKDVAYPLWKSAYFKQSLNSENG